MRSCPPAISALPLIDTHGCVKNLHSEPAFRMTVFASPPGWPLKDSTTYRHFIRLGEKKRRRIGASCRTNAARWRIQRPGYGSSMCRPDQLARRSDRWTLREIERTTTIAICGRNVRKILPRFGSPARPALLRTFGCRRSAGRSHKSTR